MRVPGSKFVANAFRWVRSRGGGVLVLGYHRLGRADDPFGLCVPETDFAQHLEVIARRARILTLGEAARAMAAGTLPRRTAVVTFDDGYADTLTTVLPLLERTGVRATVFVTTGTRGRLFWWDELAELLLKTPSLPPHLELDVGGTRRTWALGDAANRPGDDDNGTRREAVLTLAAELRRVDAAHRDELLERLRRWSGRRPVPAPPHRSLTPDEVRRLAQSPLVEIGAHTVSHPVLPTLSDAEQRHEVACSRADLQETIGKAVTSFSYPHGAYSRSTVDAVRRAGFIAACGSTPDLMTGRSELLALPRMWTYPHEPVRFARWVDRWLGA